MYFRKSKKLCNGYIILFIFHYFDSDSKNKFCHYTLLVNKILILFIKINRYVTVSISIIWNIKIILTKIIYKIFITIFLRIFFHTIKNLKYFWIQSNLNKVYSKYKDLAYNHKIVCLHKTIPYKNYIRFGSNKKIFKE